MVHVRGVRGQYQTTQEPKKENGDKKMKKLLTILGLMLGLTTLLVAAEKEIKVGITKIVEQPSLDAARKGVEKALKEKGKGKNIKIEYRITFYQYQVMSSVT